MQHLPRSLSFATCTAALLALATARAIAQDNRPIAFTNARLLTMAGEPIEGGTLVVRNGKIEAIGKDAVVPAGARVIDCSELTIMPGLVSAVSSAGLTQPPSRRTQPTQQRGRRGTPMPMPSSGGGAQDKAATRVIDGIYAKQPVFGDLLRAGVTTLALTPPGSAFPGLGAILNPDGKNLDELTGQAEGFVQIGMAMDAQTKKLLEGNFAAAAKVLEARKKPPEPKTEEKKPEEAKPEAKKEEPKPEEKKVETPPTPTPQPTPTPTPNPEPKPEPKQDPKPAPTPPPAQRRPEPPKNPNIEVLADLLEGKRRAMLEISSAAEMLHWQQVFETTPKFERTLVVQSYNSQQGTIDEVLEQAKSFECAVLLPPTLSTTPRSRLLTHPAKTLHDAGIEIGFQLGSSDDAVKQLFFRLMELVRTGLPADVALRGVTLVPAKALGVQARTGSLEVGKDADLLVFRGDPLTPSSELHAVWLRGQQVPEKP